MPIIPAKNLYIAANNNIRVKGLFKESLSNVEKGYDILSLTSDEHIYEDGKIRWYSLRQLFMEFVPDDPTEYTFAVTVFGSVKAWELIQRHPLLNSATGDYKGKLDEWRREVSLDLRSQGVKFMLEEVTAKGNNSFRAAQFLINQGWAEDTSSQKKGPGRPKKDKSEADKIEDQRLNKIMIEDAERLGLATNK